MPVTNGTLELGAKEFRIIRDRLYAISGIDLNQGKAGLVQTRLAKVLRELEIDSFAGYLEHVDTDRSGKELSRMIDLLTTNKTSFYREAHHFDLMREKLLPALFAAGGPVRIWSAGCSSGEEAYTLSNIVSEVERDSGPRDVRILATDLSSRILARASAAIYDESTLEGMPADARRRMFEPAPGRPGQYQVREPLRFRINFARLNLMDPWPMNGPFQVIFCRNVMIYFDRPTQERLVRRFHALLATGGHLFIGHSESLTGMDHDFSYLAPAAYVK